MQKKIEQLKNQPPSFVQKDFINANASIIEDKIWYQHDKGTKGVLSKIFFSKLALQVLFKYRSWITHKILE